MPEMLFDIAWPDGAEETCYSPSLIIREYFTPGQSYPLAAFVALSDDALMIASERVRAKFGFACSRALAQRARIARAASIYADMPDAVVRVVAFRE